jgi:hypothetical protein
MINIFMAVLLIFDASEQMLVCPARKASLRAERKMGFNGRILMEIALSSLMGREF